MQIKIWAESIHGGIHNSRTEPPTTSMFNCASGSSHSNVKKNSDAMSMAITQLASALAPGTSSHSTEVIDNRSKCYKQLSELKSLFESDLLSESEYAAEREAVMSVDLINDLYIVCILHNM